MVSIVNLLLKNVFLAGYKIPVANFLPELVSCSLRGSAKSRLPKIEMAVETREMSSFTLTRSPQHVGISATQFVSDSAVVEKESKTFSPNRVAGRQVSNKENSCGKATAREPKVTAQVSNERDSTVTGKSNVESKKGKEEGGKENRQVVVKSGWLMGQYCVIAEELGSSQRSSNHTKCEMCTNCCFQAYNACKCKRVSPKIYTTQLSRTRTLGIKAALRTVGSDLFTATPVGSIVKEFVVYGGSFLFLALWISALVGFILRMVSNDSNRGDNYFLAGEFAISSFGMIFTVVDLVQHMCTHRCKACKERTSGPEWRSETPDRFELSADQPDDDELKGCCKNSSKYDKAGITRFFVTPLIIYPLLLLNMFQLLSELIPCQVNITTIVSFTLVAIIQICFVYLVRIFIFLGMIHSIQKVRTGGKNQRALLKDSYFQLYFVVTAVGQMVVDLLIISAIGINIYDEYQAFLNTARKPVTFIPSAQLWYMMVFGYFATPVGLALFFITNYYCTQRFFIKFYLDILDVLEKKTAVTGAFSQNKALADFKTMEETFCGHKCIYSFISPTIAILSIIYFCSATGFIYCSLSLENPSLLVSTSVMFGPVSVTQFHLGATIVAMLVNFHAIGIAYFWLFVVWLFFAIVALAILSIPLIIIGLCCYCYIKNPPPPSMYTDRKLPTPSHLNQLPYGNWSRSDQNTYEKPSWMA